MDNRAARRKASATARRAKDRSRGGAEVPTGSHTIRTVPGPAPAIVESPTTAVEPEALVVSHYIDPGEEGSPYLAIVRLTGHRLGVQGPRTQGDTFVQEDQIDGVTPGTGPLALSSWVYGLQPGEWAVTAELLGRGAGPGTVSRGAGVPLPRAQWSWRRWAVGAGTPAPLTTRWAVLARLARMPGVVPGSWPVLGALGVLVAMLAQAAILAHLGIPIGPPLAVTMIALMSGMAAAKLWYAVLHPGPWRQAIVGGWAVDGFLVVAPLVAIVMLVASNLPVGASLDAVAPGFFLSVAIGRVGCFLTGCCAGRFSRSRWAVWSSDRRVGARRVPAQLLESAAGLMIGIAALAVILVHTPRVEGAVFVSALAAYFVVRQALLRVRAERREFSWRRRVTAVPEVA